MPEDHNGPSSAADKPADPAADWPVQFPHVELDELLGRIAAGDAGAADLERTLLLVGREAQRLRSTVMRLAAARLSAADQRARTIVEEAQQDAAALRVLAMEVLEHRLSDAETVSAAVLQAARVERRALARRSSTLRAVGDPADPADAADPTERGRS